MSDKDDCISRQTDCVLNEFGNCSYSETGCADCEIKASIRNALSAQWKRKLMYTDVSDTISRRAAIDALDCINGVEEVLRSLPSAQSERKKGEWRIAYLDHETIGAKPKVLYCSECDQCIAYPTNFCPNCGADMQER